MAVKGYDLTGVNSSGLSATMAVTSITGTGSAVDVQSNFWRFLAGTTVTSTARAILKWNSSNLALTDVQVRVLWDVPNPLVSTFPAICLRTDNTWDGTSTFSPTNGYNFEFVPSANPFAASIYKLVAGTNTAIVSTGTVALTAGNPVWQVAEAVGTTVRQKFWDSVASTEPSAWLHSATDSSLVSGGVQLRNLNGSGSNRTCTVRFLSINDEVLVDYRTPTRGLFRGVLR